MAGLALVFAMAFEKEEKPPMILLDEVDAHLDQDNVNLLVSFINSLKSEKSCPQILMISHKETAVSQCDSLIGVTQQEYTKQVGGLANDDRQGLNGNR